VAAAACVWSTCVAAIRYKLLNFIVATQMFRVGTGYDAPNQNWLRVLNHRYQHGHCG
jgi:hypothetical protein